MHKFHSSFGTAERKDRWISYKIIRTHDNFTNNVKGIHITKPLTKRQVRLLKCNLYVRTSYRTSKKLYASLAVDSLFIGVLQMMSRGYKHILSCSIKNTLNTLSQSREEARTKTSEALNKQSPSLGRILTADGALMGPLASSALSPSW